jgi:SAM-dependent methyltransferase
MAEIEVSATAAHAGAAVYTGRVLSLYDFWVHGLSNPFAWRCPTEVLKRFYTAHTRARHLDVGVGSGYFLDNCNLEPNLQHLALLDLNRTALSYASSRVSRYRPSTHQANVLEPLCLSDGPFDSIALMYLLHCVPGDFTQKGVAFSHLGSQLASDGVLFGATILGSGVAPTPLGRWLMKVYNRRRIFCNCDDSREGLERALSRCFRTFNVEVRGVVALFEARDYRTQ